MITVRSLIKALQSVKDPDVPALIAIVSEAPSVLPEVPAIHISRLTSCWDKDTHGLTAVVIGAETDEPAQTRGYLN